MTADRENQFAQVTRMSQEKRALSDRRAQARRATEQVEISRQIAARTPLPKPKGVEKVQATDPSLASNLEVTADNELDMEDIEADELEADELEADELEADDDDAKVDRSA